MSPVAEELENRHYTYADILQWDETPRYELFDGEACKMETPNTFHQEICGSLSVMLYNFLKGKPCEVFFRLGVRLFPQEDNSDNTFFQPDIIVVCDPSKLDKQGCNGAPDLVVEILSPSTVKNDLFYKLNKYLSAGVREYWIVDPDEEIILVNVLTENRYIISKYALKDTVEAVVLPGFKVTLKDIFRE
jgi:Uma2 family endonuclease